MWRGLLVGVISGGGLAGLLFIAAALVLPPVQLTLPNPPEAQTAVPSVAAPTEVAAGAGTPSAEGAPPSAASAPALAEAPEGETPAVSAAPAAVPATPPLSTALEGGPEAGDTPELSTAPEAAVDTARAPAALGDEPGADATPIPAPLPEVGLQTATPAAPEPSPEPGDTPELSVAPETAVETARIPAGLGDEPGAEAAPSAAPEPVVETLTVTPAPPGSAAPPERPASDPGAPQVATASAAPIAPAREPLPDLPKNGSILDPEVATQAVTPITPVAEGPPAPPAQDGLGSVPVLAALAPPNAPPAAPEGEVSLPASDGPAPLAPAGPEPSAEPAERPAPPPPLTFDPPRLPGNGLRVPQPGLNVDPNAQTRPAPASTELDPQPQLQPSGPAISAFAAPFAPATDQPRLGLVLIDTEIGRSMPLSSVPVPLAVAVDPLAPDALLRMAELRQAGAEVLVLAPLPEGATPADVEVAFQAFLGAVPEAIGVMDLPEALMQAGRPRASQVVDIVKASGHGVVTYKRGFNALLQIAEAQEVPVLSVARVFDTGDSSAQEMKRGLDQGAFETGRSGRALLVGQLRPETLEMLGTWASGNRAANLELAPVSAVLQGL